MWVEDVLSTLEKITLSSSGIIGSCDFENKFFSFKILLLTVGVKLTTFFPSLIYTIIVEFYII